MEHTFRRALVSAVIGLQVGAIYVLNLLRLGTCPDLLGTATGPVCSRQDVVEAGLVVFTLVTLALTLLVAGLGLRAGPAPRRVVLGDTFLAIGSMVAMVQAAALAVTGAPLGLAYGLAVFALSLVAVRRAGSATRHDREVATVVAMLLTMGAVIWVAFDPGAILLGLPVTGFWVLGALGYLDAAHTAEDPRLSRPTRVRAPADG